jgi:hypothetical protein
MLDEIGRGKEALQKVGEAVLNEKQQLMERMTKVNSQPADQMEFTAFEQQRPLAPAATARISRDSPRVLRCLKLS